MLASGCASYRSHCATSQRARAAGSYQDQTAQAAAAADSEYTYACLKACYDGFSEDHPVGVAQNLPPCVEANLLAAEADPRKGMDAVIKMCAGGSGPALACEWVDAHKEEIVVWKDTAAKADARDRAAAEAREAEAVRQSLVPDNVAAMRRAVAKLESEAASKGQRLLSEAEYSLKTHGYVSFPLYLIMGNYYVIAIVGSRVTTFTAKIGGGGFNTLVLDERYVDGDVFVRSNGFTNDGRTNEATPSVFITADGGNRGAVQVLVFTQD